MKKVDFNEYSHSYDEIIKSQLKHLGDISYYAEYKVKILKALTSKKENINILEFGCGIGRNLFYIKQYFPKANIFGFDISEKSLTVAKKIDDSFVLINNIERLKEKYLNHFDIIFIAGVYHHIPPKDRNKNTAILLTLLKDGGKLLLFDHNPYNPITRRLVSTCEFDKDAVLLTLNEIKQLFKKNHFKVIFSKYTLFFPPKLKKIAFLENCLKWIPLGGQYCVCFEKDVE